MKLAADGLRLTAGTLSFSVRAVSRRDDENRELLRVLAPVMIVAEDRGEIAALVDVDVDHPAEQ